MNGYKIYTDGGADRGGNAAAATIIERPSGERVRVVAYLGTATNNEAEISAVLLALAAIRAYENLDSSRISVSWFADSEYTLLSATKYIQNWERNGWKTAQKEPVKNQGLWRIYLQLSSGMQISANHVRGHAGHPENEACDEACNWLKSFAPSWDRRTFVEELPFDHGAWLVVDIESVIDFARSFVAGQPAVSFANEGANYFCQIVNSIRDIRNSEPIDPETQFQNAVLRLIKDVRVRAEQLPGDPLLRNRFLASLDILGEEYALKKKC